MKNWEEFEIQCYEDLNGEFGEYAKFLLMGGSNSNTSDIKVETLKQKEFFIEIKHSPAHCGQFVLLPNLETKSFDYSKLNTTPINKSALQIIDFMNKNFESFKEAGTSGKSIDIKNSSKIFSKWIIETYKHKNVKFFISNDNIIIPIEKISKYFNIKATYRVKRSGSSKVENRDVNLIKDYISNNYAISTFYQNNGSLFVSSNENLHNKRFIITGFEYMLSARDDNYEIRKLSNTFNANVIFSIELKSNVFGVTKKKFIKYLKN